MDISLFSTILRLSSMCWDGLQEIYSVLTSSIYTFLTNLLPPLSPLRVGLQTFHYFGLGYILDISVFEFFFNPHTLLVVFAFAFVTWFVDRLIPT